MGIVIGIVVAVLLLAAVALYVKVRRFERDVEVPAPEMTDEEKHAQLVRRSAAANVIGGVNGGGSM